MSRLFFILLPIMISGAIISGCAVLKPSPHTETGFTRLSPQDYPDFTDLKDPESLAKAVGYSIDYLSRLPGDMPLEYGEDAYTAASQKESFERLREFLRAGPSAGLVKKYVEEKFIVYSTQGADGRAFFTGYYTPELDVSAEMGDKYRFPLYRMPGDMVSVDLGLFRESLKGQSVSGRVEDGRLVPYYSREQIEEGALSGKGLEAAWCANPVDLFFLQVQGSGVLVYRDGVRKVANFAGANGRPYRSIGKFLIEKGLCGRDEMSLDYIKKYITAHPEQRDEILNYNESYVFFNIGDDGPDGCLGVPVTGERTVATDRRIYPPGALAFIDTEAPLRLDDGSVGWAPYRGFVMNQDTGGAIKGPGRVDIYFGPGEAAGFRAGYMKRAGRLYFLAGKEYPTASQ